MPDQKLADHKPANRKDAIWQDGYWFSADGLRLHYRDYAGVDDGRPPLLCLPGLTRNSRDFKPLAKRLAGRWRLICPDLRGRAESAFAKDPMTYVPLTYMQDIGALIAELNLPPVIAVGTSLGGLITMLLAAGRERLAGAILNDIGPVIEPEGMERIRGYVGSGGSQPTWVHAARALAESNGDVYPEYRLEDWLKMAKRLYRLNSAGRIVLDYDMRIAEPLRMPGGEAGVDMWPAIDAMKGLPTLVVRGALSDLFSPATAQEMVRRIGTAELVTVPRVGHAPVLDEGPAAEAIDALLDRIFAPA